MTNVFAVVGEHRAAPDRLLLLGDDGRYYAFAADSRPTEVEPTGAWRLDDEISVSATAATLHDHLLSPAPRQPAQLAPAPSATESPRA